MSMTLTTAPVDVADRIQFWNDYLDARTGTYEFRCRRYDAVLDRLQVMGIRRNDSILDVGAGRMEFARRARERGHHGLYIPEDGSIDGVELNEWTPRGLVGWTVCIEVVEHVENPKRLMTALTMSTRGAVITTPNPDVVDVMGMDHTHVSEVSGSDLTAWGWQWQALPLFTDDPDTLVAWWQR